MTSFTVKLTTAIAALSLATSFYLPANADTLQGTAYRSSGSCGTTHVSATKRYFRTHPKMRGAAIGAGVGAGVGAATGLITHKGVVRGAAIGAGAGAATGAIHNSATMHRHPIVKDLAEGAVIGGGLGLAAKRGHGSVRTAAKTAAVGGAIGLGIGLIKDKLR